MLISLVLFCAFVCYAAAVPSWQSFTSRATLGSLVSGANAIEAVGLPSNKRFFLSVSGPPGEPSNVTIDTVRKDPPLYFVDRQQLYQWTNDTYILSVNVLNSTTSEEDPMPYKLVLDTEKHGLKGAVWRWRGTDLHVDYLNMSNRGHFYTCKNSAGRIGTYLFLDVVDMDESSTPPQGCYAVKLHTYTPLLPEEEERKQQTLQQSRW